MRRSILSLLAATPALAAAPASAAIVLNPDGSLSISSDTTIGESYTINFDGSSSGTPIAGLSSSLMLTFAGLDGNNWTFGYDLLNTSGAPLTSANVMGFGFDVAPDLLGASVTGDFNTTASGSISNGYNVDVCFKNGQGNDCAGGGDTGFAMNQNAEGEFVLEFAGGTTDIALDNFIVRYQGINGPGIRDGSGIGEPTGAVPEPSTWAMMLFGFGAVGFAMRRRKDTHATKRLRVSYS
jgi:hypothetical protein